MNPRATAASLLLIAIAACDGSSTDGTDGGPARPEGGASSDRVGTGPGGGPRDLGQFEALPPTPVPTLNPMAKRMIPGRARLVGTHGSACTNQAMSAERWCAFTLPSEELGKTELWVINVAKAATTDVKCDNAMGADCKRLTNIPLTGGDRIPSLWTGAPDAGPIHPTAHRFDGDTLIFYADPKIDVDIYSGRVFAWRPGWPVPRVLSGGQGVTCSAHRTMEVASCIENITAATVMPLQFDLTAGKLSELPLKKIARITPERPSTDSSQYSYGFTRAADWFLWSTGGKTVNDFETLYAVRTDDIATLGPDPDTSAKRMTIATGISRWTLSNDGKRFLWLKDYNYNTEGRPSGTFEMADFPTGQNPKVIAPKVGWFTTLFDGTENDRGYAFMDNFMASKAPLKAVRDPADTTKITTVLDSTAGATFSRDLRWVLFSKTFDPEDQTIDLWASRLDDPAKAPCSLTTSVRADVYGTPFLPNGNLAFWVDNIQLEIGVGEAWVGNPDGCTGKRKFANGMDFWFLSGNNAMVYSDQGNGETATLNYRLVKDGNALSDDVVKVQDGIERVYAILPNFESTLYMIDPDPRAAGAEAAAGIYYYKFPAFSGAATDGGAPASDASGGQ